MRILRHHGSTFLLACMAMVFGWSIEIRQATATQTGTERASPDFAAIDAYVSQQMHDLHIPGIALGIVQGSRIVHVRGFGVADDSSRPVTVQTPLRIGSITKSFTALAVLQLAEAGSIELDASVQRYLPWFRVADEASSAHITVRQLLNQTSGFSTLSGNAHWDSQDGLETMVRQLRTAQLSAPVGTRFQYSNVNYAIAGLLVEVVSGQAFADYVAQHIFAPLAMQHSSVATAPTRADGLAMGHRYSIGRMVADAGVVPPAYVPAGFISASVEDMTHYAMAQLNGGRYGDTSILSKRGIAQLHHPATSIGDVPAGPKNSFYGMGWVVGPINDAPAIWHNGDTGRFHATLILVPARDWGVVLLTNASGFELPVAVDAMAKGVLRLLDGQPVVASSSHIVYRCIYWAVLLTPVLLLLGMAHGWQRWRRGDLGVFAQPLHGRSTPWRRVLAMVIPNLTVALFFMLGVPRITGMPLSAFRLLYPELGHALMASIVIGIAWSLVYTMLAVQLRRRARQHGDRSWPMRR